jgi:large subunit ribosomal protein L19
MAKATKQTAKKVKKAAKPKSKVATTDLITRVTLARAQAKTLPDFKSGDTVGVYVKIKEGEKERVQLFKGIVIKMQGTGISRSFTVRKISFGVGVERSFPMASPSIDRIEVLAEGKVRRSRLFYLRGLKGKAANIESDLLGTEAAAAAIPAEEIPQP